MHPLARLIKEETRMHCKKIARMNRLFFQQHGIKHLVNWRKARRVTLSQYANRILNRKG